MESSPHKQVLLMALLLWSGRAVRFLFGCQAVLTNKAWPPLGTKRSQLMMQTHPFGQATPEIIWMSLVLLPFQILAHSYKNKLHELKSGRFFLIF